MGGVAESSLVCPELGLLVGGGLVGRTSWGETLPVLTFPKGLLPPLLFLRRGCVGVVGRSVLSLFWMPQYLGGSR